MKTGDVFHQRFIVSKDIYTGFIQLFNDRNPLHCDPNFALQKGFQSVVMHGNILNGFISFFIGECLPIKNVILLSQQIQYNNPIYLNDVLDFSAEVTQVFDSVCVIEFKFLFQKDTGIKVAQGNIQIKII